MWMKLQTLRSYVAQNTSLFVLHCILANVHSRPCASFSIVFIELHERVAKPLPLERGKLCPPLRAICLLAFCKQDNP